MAPAHGEIFVLDLVRPDGSAFVTTAGFEKDITPIAARAGAVRGAISHWKRKSRSTHEPATWRHPRDGWELQSRTPL